MSDETPPSSDLPDFSSEGPQPAPKTKRASSARSKKAAKRAKSADAAQPAEAAPAPADAPEPSSHDATEESAPDSAVDATEPASGDWPEPATSEGGTAGESKRKRRRKKKGGQQQAAENAPAAQPENNEAPRAPRPQHDPDHLAKNAWKIYLAEVSEEGVALVGDNDARELARRCFRLAEIFMDEQARRR